MSQAKSIFNDFFLSVLLRSFDVFSSSIALIILSPLFLLIAVLIRINSSGSVFFRQTRLGKNRREFSMVKFRTMSINSENIGNLVTAAGDKRVTSIGNLLRRTKLDELPELWNVLIGDMSLVGPRPEVPRYVAYYKTEWNEIFSLRPGVTDLATLQFRDEEKVLSYAVDKERSYIDVVLPIKANLALEYVQNISIRLYFKILFLTVWSITIGRLLAAPDHTLADKAILLIRQELDFKENIN